MVKFSSDIEALEELRRKLYPSSIERTSCDELGLQPEKKKTTSFHSDKEFYHFHEIMKAIVEERGEDILYEKVFREFLFSDDFPIKEDCRIFDILVYMTRHNMLSMILDHETNNWDNKLTTSFREFAKELDIDESQTLYVARSIAFALNMDVDLGVSTKLTPSASNRNHLYSAQELCDKITFLRGKDTTSHVQSVRVKLCPYQRAELELCIKENLGGYDGKPFCIQVLVRRPDDSLVFAQSSGTLYRNSISDDDEYRLTLKLSHKLYTSDYVSRIEIITTKEIIRNIAEMDFSYIKRCYDYYEGFYYSSQY